MGGMNETVSTILKDTSFELVTEFIKPDKKKRITLSGAVTMGAFNLYLNKCGQLILDPVKVVPTSEAWLYENKKALDSVQKGLQESAAGKVHSLGSFAKFIKE